MTVVLDTCAVIWAISDPAQLPDQATRLLEAEETEVCVSVISCAEIACAAERGRIEIDRHWRLWFRHYVELNGWTVLPIKLESVEGYALPAPFHRDPADRIIVCRSPEAVCCRCHGRRTDPNYPHVKVVFPCGGRHSCGGLLWLNARSTLGSVLGNPLRMSGIHTTPTTPVDIYLIHLALVLASGSATRTRSGPRRRVGAVFPLALVFRRSTGLDYFIRYDGMIFIPYDCYDGYFWFKLSGRSNQEISQDQLVRWANMGLGEQWNRKYGRRLDLGPPE